MKLKGLPVLVVCLLAAAYLAWGGLLPVIGGSPPFKTDKLAVLVVEESADRGKYTSDQLDVIASSDEKSVGAIVRGRGGEFQVIDVDTAPQTPWVKEAAAVKRDSLPWIVGATSSGGFSAPLTTEADAIARIGRLR